MCYYETWQNTILLATVIRKGRERNYEHQNLQKYMTNEITLHAILPLN
jgi:hypothetical protein